MENRTDLNRPLTPPPDILMIGHVTCSHCHWFQEGFPLGTCMKPNSLPFSPLSGFMVHHDAEHPICFVPK